LLQENSTPGTLKKNEDSLDNSHFSPKRPRNNGNKLVIAESSSEKKPKLDLANETKEASIGSSVSAPIVEPVKKVTGNGSGLENT